MDGDNWWFDLFLSLTLFLMVILFIVLLLGLLGFAIHLLVPHV